MTRARSRKSPSAATLAAPARNIGPKRKSVRIGVLLGLTALVTAALTILFWINHRTSATRQPDPPGGAIATTPGVDPSVARAIDAARAEVIRQPQTAGNWGRLGMVLGLHGYHTEAMDAFTEAERLDPRDARWPYFQASDLCRADAQQALAALRRASNCDVSSDGPARLALAEALLRDDRYDEAATELDRALRRRPEDPRTHLDLARLALARGDTDGTLLHLQRCASDPHARLASLLLAGQAHQRRGDTSASTKDIAAAGKLPLDPAWPDAWMDQADALRTGLVARISRVAALLNLNRNAQALTDASQLAADYPDAGPAWLLLGRARLKSSDYPGALKALDQARRLAPDSADALFFTGTALLYQQNYAGAADVFRKTVAIQPDFAEAHHNLGHCLLGVGNRSGAIEEFREATRCKPNLAEAHLDLGRQLAAAGQAQAAAAELRRALKLAPDDPRARRALEDLAGHP